MAIPQLTSEDAINRLCDSIDFLVKAVGNLNERLIATEDKLRASGFEDTQITRINMDCTNSGI